jgi:hypothetical protein
MGSTDTFVRAFDMRLTVIAEYPERLTILIELEALKEVVDAGVSRRDADWFLRSQRVRGLNGLGYNASLSSLKSIDHILAFEAVVKGVLHHSVR